MGTEPDCAVPGGCNTPSVQYPGRCRCRGMKYRARAAQRRGRGILDQCGTGTGTGRRSRRRQRRGAAVRPLPRPPPPCTRRALPVRGRAGLSRARGAEQPLPLPAWPSRATAPDGECSRPGRARDGSCCWAGPDRSYGGGLEPAAAAMCGVPGPGVAAGRSRSRFRCLSRASGAGPGRASGRGAARQGLTGGAERGGGG